MSSHAKVTPAEFKSALTPSAVHPGIVIQLTLAAGVLFLFIYGYILDQKLTDVDLTRAAIETLSVIHAFFFLLAVLGGQWLYSRQFTLKRLQEFRFARAPAIELLLVVRKAYFYRSALLEAAAFFGLMILSEASRLRLLDTKPILWLNAASGLYQIVFILSTLPTRNKLESLFENRIQQS